MESPLSLLCTGIALAALSLTPLHAVTFPVFEDIAGSTTSGTIARARVPAKAFAISGRTNAYLNFAVSAGQGDPASEIIPASVSTARLVLFLPNAGTTGILSIKTLTTGFTENILAPAKSIPAPTFGATLETIDLAQASLKGDYYITDITAQVKAWLADPASEFGIAITSDGTAKATLASKEGVANGHAAYIEVDVAGGGAANFTGPVQVGDFAAAGVDSFLTVAGAGVNQTNPAADRLTGIKLRNFDNNFGITFQYRDGLANSGLEILRHSNNAAGTTAFFIGRESGNVGIGTNNPSQASLVINGSNGSTNIGTFGLLATFGGQGNNAGVNLQGNSIYANGNIAGFQIIAFSDARIKNIQGISDRAADLRTLQNIEITDYFFKDVALKGRRPQKKVIAQQVEKVFPQAVHQSTDVVPDIYQKAVLKDGWVQLATDLKVGDRVRLIAEKEEGIHEVLEVSATAFRTAFQPATEQIFVYGREVNDFRQVDYDAIAMLNVSATQELAKRLEAKDAELTTLRAANTALAEKLSALEARDAAREARLTRLENALDPLPPQPVQAGPGVQ